MSVLILFTWPLQCCLWRFRASGVQTCWSMLVRYVSAPAPQRNLRGPWSSSNQNPPITLRSYPLRQAATSETTLYSVPKTYAQHGLLSQGKTGDSLDHERPDADSKPLDHRGASAFSCVERLLEPADVSPKDELCLSLANDGGHATARYSDVNAQPKVSLQCPWEEEWEELQSPLQRYFTGCNAKYRFLRC